jgi:hypothetical protein
MVRTLCRARIWVGAGHADMVVGARGRGTVRPDRGTGRVRRDLRISRPHLVVSLNVRKNARSMSGRFCGFYRHIGIDSKFNRGLRVCPLRRE